MSCAPSEWVYCCWSSTSGVSAPLTLDPVLSGEEDRAEDEAWLERSSAETSEGDGDRGVEIWLAVLEPRVAATEGDGGGSGDRVK